MYNNDVTYADKWETPENKAALAILEKKYFNKSECSPSCPVAWAPEVLEMMDYIQENFGFKHNTKTIRGYHIQGNPYEWFVKDPWSNFFTAFNNNVFGEVYDYIKVEGQTTKKKIKRPLMKRIKRIFSGTFFSVGYGLRASRVLYVNPILNKLQRNQVTLGQLKEKYGSIRCYFDAGALEEAVEYQVRKCEMKLAMKGCYYPVESFWNAGSSYHVGNEYRPDIITSKVLPDGTISITETKYRAVMQELGLDLKEIAAKASPKDET